MVRLDPATQLPTIDLSSYLNSSSMPKYHSVAVSAVQKACRDFGFFQLTGHGIPLTLQRSILSCCERLFSLPLEAKLVMSMNKSMGLSKRGYEVAGSQSLDDRPDTKEGFYVGVEMDKCNPEAGTFLKGPNVWPEDLEENMFKGPVMEYHRRVLKLHEILLGILEEGLIGEGLMGNGGKAILEEFRRDPVANLKLLHYPTYGMVDDEGGEEEESIGAGAHTDFGFTTILLQQPDQHGLQVWYPPSNSWIPVPAKEDVLVVNVGDLLDKWTRGKYRSAVHRVVNVSTTNRYSVPFFYHGNLTTRLKPLDRGEDPEAETATVEEHIKGRFRKTFGS